MSLFKVKITFLQACDYSFNTWEKHYIPNKEQYISDAIDATGLTGKLALSDAQIDFIWTELEYLHNYLLIVYAYYYFAGKHSAKQVAGLVTERYLDYLVIGLRKKSAAAAMDIRDDFAKYVEEVETKTATVKNRGALDADSMATFGVMTTSERINAQMPGIDHDILKYLFQRAWAAAQASYATKIKIIWE